MDRPRLYVDFNEMLDSDLVLLSKADEKVDSSGEWLLLHEGLPVFVYMDDEDAEGRPDPLIAEGVAERTTGRAEWTEAVRWCCRIKGRGIRHLSED